MKRSELVAKLETCAPALSTNTLIPIMQHFWFRGDHLMAYNDAIAISVPCETDFEAAVPGKMLLSLLNASKATDVELTHEKGELTVKLATSRLHLATMPPKNFNFDMPKLKTEASINGDAVKFMKAITICLNSVTIDTSVPDQLGVTVIGDEDQLLFFATNHNTFSHAHMKLPQPTKFSRAILSASFCREMLDLHDKKKGVQLQVNTKENYSLFEGAGGSVLFGKLVETDKPLPYTKTFDHYFPEGSEKKLVAMPTKLQLIIDRACIVADANNNRAVMMGIVVTNGKAKFVTADDKTEIFDNVELEAKQPNVSLSVNPKLLKNGYDLFDKMHLTERAFIMASSSAFYMVSHNEG